MKLAPADRCQVTPCLVTEVHGSMPSLVAFIRLVLVLSFIVVLAGPADANPRVLQTNYSSYIVENIVIPDLPLDQALEVLKKTASDSSGGRINFNFVFLDGMPERKVSLDLQHMPLEHVVEYFAEVAGMRARINGTTVEFTSTAPRKAAKTRHNAGAAAKQEQTNESPNRPIFSSASFNFINNYIKSITMGWRSESRTKKSESQKQVLFRDTTGRSTETFLEAVEDLNRVFGYQKLVPQLSTKNDAKDQAIVVMLGPEKDAKRFLRDSGARSPGAHDVWSGWFWWDDSNEMSKAVIAIYQEKINDHSLGHYIRRSLLTALGYPGATSRLNSIFDEYHSRFPNLKTRPGKEPQTAAFISEWDVAILRFCDRFLATDASRTNIRKVITQEWPKFSDGLDRARVDPLPASE